MPKWALLQALTASELFRCDCPDPEAVCCFRLRYTFIHVWVHSCLTHCGSALRLSLASRRTVGMTSEMHHGAQIKRETLTALTNGARKIPLSNSAHGHCSVFSPSSGHLSGSLGCWSASSRKSSESSVGGASPSGSGISATPPHAKAFIKNHSIPECRMVHALARQVYVNVKLGRHRPQGCLAMEEWHGVTTRRQI